ncbi:alpha/beta hydrolase [Phaeobacter sp. J2-8]|uniref:alpha/beta fold hydrolase n=1 Tax=Phaeobacter sp. J2-8 TaxID=2931394 RepID=UPI001FD59AB7|nr:alpha/beta hydrolase [Phaeobacter sp. J2-8]MCJ7873521.1 alpha/beta hydrolase [Phaeobacter sp. J2-8]
MGELQTYLSDGVEYAERSGDGPVVVLLHGIGSNAASFAPLLPQLPADWRVVIWNAPGYGRSEPLPDNWPVASDYAEALAGLFDRLNLQDVLLAGHSLGTLVAAAFATTYRERVSRLLLASPALGHGMARGGALSPAAQARIDDLTTMGAKDFAAARADRLVFEPGANPDLVAGVRRSMEQVQMPGYGQAARMLASGRLLDDAQRLCLRTDVIVGAGDRITPPDGAARVHAALRPDWRGRFTQLPAAGHALYQQDPKGFATAMAHLIEDARNPGKWRP